jgi:hypothetical protein
VAAAAGREQSLGEVGDGLEASSCVDNNPGSQQLHHGKGAPREVFGGVAGCHRVN